ncbi:hypothetical protein BDZ94DRAFT_1354618, partial [Collybia nuda]
TNLTPNQNQASSKADLDAYFALPPSVIKLREEMLKDYTCPISPPSDSIEAQPLTKLEYYSLQHYIIWRTTNSTVATYKGYRAVIVQATNTEILSLYKVVKLALDKTHLFPIVVDMCPKSCIAYTGDYAHLNCCPYIRGGVLCKTPRYRQAEKNISHAQFKTLPILGTICRC